MKKQNKKFGLSFFIKLLCGFGFGGLIGMIASGGFKLPVEYTALPVYVNIAIIIFTYLFAVSAHELGHFISFIKNGIKMRALVVSIFLFIKENGRWRFKFGPNKITLIGGIAVPDLGVVKNEADFRRLQIAYSKAIIAGPLTSITLWIVVCIIIVPIILTVANIYLKSMLFTFLVSLTLTTIFLIVTSFFKSEIAVGDFPAYTLTKNDSFFTAMQLYQYAFLSSDPESTRRENKYLKDMICEGLSKKLNIQDVNIYTLNIIDTLLVEYLAGVSDKLPQTVSKYIAFLLDNPHLLKSIKESEITLLLRFHIIRLLYTNEDTKQKAKELFYELKGEIKRVTPVSNYLIKQAEHFLGLADHSEYLKNKNNIRVSAAHGLWKNFDGYLIDEIKLNKM